MALCLAFITRALSAADVYVVASSDAAPYLSAQDALQRKLEKAGYKVHRVELKDFDESQSKKASSDPHTSFVAIGSDAAEALHKRIAEPHPVIYCMVADPDGLGLNGGKSIYGVNTNVPISAQTALIAQALPRAHTIGLLLQSDNADDRRVCDSLKEALPAGWSVETIYADQQKSVSKAIDTLFDRKIDIVWTTPDSTVFDQATLRSLLLTSLRRKIPVFGYSQGLVKAGALFGVCIDPQTQGEQAAALLDRVRKGQKENMSPEYDIAVNLNVAERMSINLSDSVIGRAKVIIRK